MKLSSSTLCGCCFCCYCHCWLMMLLMVSSIVHVSPEISTITNKKSSKLYNNNYAYRSKMTDFIQPSRKLLNSKITAATVTTASTTSMLSKLSPLPTPQPQPTAFIPTTDIHYKQNTRNSYPVFEHETKTTVDSKQTKSTISSRVLASGTQPLTSTSASKQLQITERSNQYDTPIAGPAPTKSKSRRKTEHESQGTSNTFNRHFELLSASSRTTMTNNYAADKSNVFLPSTLLRIEQTTINPFIQTVAKVKTKKSINDYSRNYDSDKSKKYGNLTVDSKSILKQEYIDITAGSNKSKSSKSDKDCKQKTKYSFCINHNNRVAAIKTNSATINTTTQALQQKCLETKMESKSRNAFDATQKKASAINSLPSNCTTDFLRHSRNNFKSHKSNSSRTRSRSSNSYDHMSSSTPKANSTSHKEISQYPVHAYHLHKRTSTPTTTTSSLSLQLQLPSDSWSLHEHRHSNIVQRSVLLHRHGRQAAAEEEQSEKCRMFIEGDPEKNELYSPEYPNDYPKNINCTRIITAPKGQIIRLDFRNSFNIEEKEECKFDFLEVRDGQYGFSNLIGKYCGTDFPPEITSKERYLWLHFHSDESIEYSGFTAVYEFIDRNRDAPSTDLNCTIEKDGFEGFINATDVPTEIKDTVIRNKIPLDCIWRIEVQEKWKIQIKFVDFKLAKPNDCETNFLDIFPEQTVMPLRVKNFCGSAGEGITSDSNILHMRFYAEQIAINSTFSILYTAFRERGSSSCAEDEYDCEDATCIAADLKCNGRSNCKFLWDEEGCEEEDEGQSEHMIIIITVFGLILGGMVVTFLVNCIRKIMHDQKIIREVPVLRDGIYHIDSFILDAPKAAICVGLQDDYKLNYKPGYEHECTTIDHDIIRIEMHEDLSSNTSFDQNSHASHSENENSIDSIGLHENCCIENETLYNESDKSNRHHMLDRDEHIPPKLITSHCSLHAGLTTFPHPDNDLLTTPTITDSYNSSPAPSSGTANTTNSSGDSSYIFVNNTATIPVSSSSFPASRYRDDMLHFQCFLQKCAH